MRPHRQQFIEAVRSKKKFRVRFYAQADSGVLERVCAPMDYGTGGEVSGEPNRYWLFPQVTNV